MRSRQVASSGFWRLLASIAAALLLGACASTPRGKLRAALDQTYSPRLSRIASSDQLARFLTAAAALPPTAPVPEFICDTCLVLVSGSRIAPADIVTNNQESGVDEGDIVKKSGSDLFVLREGVLYSITLEDNGAPALRQRDAHVLGQDKDEDIWYDEILVSGEQLFLLAFNSEHDVAELRRFRIDALGRITPAGRYWLRADDYFSGDNYGARLRGDELIISLSWHMDAGTGEQDWPSWSRRDVPDPQWHPLMEVSDLYMPIAPVSRPVVNVVLHCPLALLDSDDLGCRSTGIVSSSRGDPYVTAEYTYLATTEWDEDARLQSGFREQPERAFTAVFRIPADAREPVAVARGEGTAQNQYSFKEAGGQLYLATAAREAGKEAVLLQKIAAADFGQHARPARQVMRIPYEGRLRELQIDTSLWLAVDPLTEDAATTLIVQPLGGGPVRQLALPHETSRLQPGFGHMFASGEDEQGDWQISMLQAGGGLRRVASQRLAAYWDDSSFSHSMNLASLADGTRVVAIALTASPRSQMEAPREIVFFRLEDAALAPGGTLQRSDAPAAAACLQSCEDWYGNARAFFVGDRVFALLDDELQEGRIVNGVIVPRRTLQLQR